MPDTPLNPDALAKSQGSAMDAWMNGESFHYATERAIRAYLAVAQPEVNSVESIPAQVQVISWEEEPEHECWKLAPDETFVGLIVKSDRAWSPADRYTLNIERPEVKP